MTLDAYNLSEGKKWLHRVSSEGTKNVTIDGTSAVTVGSGVNSVEMIGFRILANFTGNLVITGFGKKSSSAEAAKSHTFTTPTAGYYEFPGINEAGSLTVQASNAADDELAVIFYRDVN